MNLYEYQAKKLMVKYNLPILKGFVYGTINDIEHAIVANSIGSGPWVVKCQIQAGGRGKSGGVCIVHSSKKLLSFSNKWIGNRLVTYQTDDIGELVCSVLIEPAVKIIHELYLSVSIDRDASQIICMASTQGGVNVEMTEKTTSNLIHKIIINPSVGIYPYQGRILACKLGLSGSKINQFSRIIVSTTNMLIENDLTLIEINPLAITDDDHFCCLDAKVIIDQNAIFRQSNLLNTCTINKPDNTLNFNYIPLEGNIGCMVNGAGLAMATMDVIKSMGGIPANFLDIGGGANKECIISAFNMILKNTKVLAILVNIFGGIVCCDLVAECILTALSKHTSKYIPIIARLEGNNSTLGSNRLINSKLNIFVTNNLIHAIQKIVTAVNLKNVHFN
ncbi:ADP-forming succinate--CoA ligase subunit beta [Blochmannia endosymbiont of Camponotus sp. C-003]|uniref:ADP-forming succinate--CoA ligase subunit beta n=1 Tax=unclassified Candidatus Blochmanniella TaxID=711328 RepID=UPI0020247ED2|nr:MULTISPECIES: ADP-forming succinate--CoA ligase subunit beta [unclassified Candidatus Blochmannia]URJ23479.1 ADP-forming succinate--CoA ligase subunit beta [Blochmannia endosymbiont of Camponotus sp. C-003]URJ28951.1 ADP-forming succinate--CoA ligase subunit beta [Blochmannia endosymbiont of Camponotus sp. C-046]